MDDEKHTIKTEASLVEAELRKQLTEAVSSKDKSESEAIHNLRNTVKQKQAALEELTVRFEKEAHEHLSITAALKAEHEASDAAKDQALHQLHHDSEKRMTDLQSQQRQATEVRNCCVNFVTCSDHGVFAGP